MSERKKTFKPKSKRRFQPKKKHFNRRKKQVEAPAKIDVSKYINNGNSDETQGYQPKNRFDDFNLDKELLFRIEKKGFSTLTEIQDKAIPHIQTGKDLIGIAGTGTGKTAAFLIPIVNALITNKQDHYALVVTPTRELANQINDEFRSLTKGLCIFSTCLIGGSSIGDSIRNLKRINHLVIGTPGRIMDMHKQGHLPFNRFKTFVLDEFDRMLDMGFKDETRRINRKMTNKRQTLLFSATVDSSQREIINEIVGKAKEIKATAQNRDTRNIQQDVIRVNGRDKFELMHELIAEREDEKVLLFCETRRKAERMTKRLDGKKVKADTIHGDKSQKAREVALRKFKKGRINVLVATDVVARGIDVNDVSLVINYEVPRNYTDYIHRIGRTGRAGKTGNAITMID